MPLFGSDEHRPIAGTTGAYALLMVGDSADRQLDWKWDGSRYLFWAEQLSLSREAPADKYAIYGELLARRGQHREALEAFLRIPAHGLPIFSIELRLGIDRLLSYRDLAAGSGAFDGNSLAAPISVLGRVAPMSTSNSQS